MAEHGLTLRRMTRSGIVEKGITLGLLFILLASAITGMTTTLEGPNLASLALGLIFGLLLGWALALGHQKALLALVIIPGVGLLFLLLVPGGLWEKIPSLAVDFLRRGLGLFPFYKGPGVSPEDLARRAGDLAASMQILAHRVQGWIAALFSNQPVFDPVAAGLVWNSLVWLVAAWAGWIIEARRNVLLSVLPALLLSLITLSTGRHTTSGVYLMLGASLLLLATSGQDHRRRVWDSNQMAYPEHKGRQILAASFGLTIGLVILAALLPSLSIKSFREWVDAHRRSTVRQQSSLARSLGILPGATASPDAFRAVRSPGLPRDHLIGAGPELAGRVVMTVRVPDLDTLSGSGQPLPLYWRGFTYDIYTGQGWSSSSTTEQAVPANAPLQADRSPGHTLIQQDVSPVENLGGTIYAAGEPVRLNLDSQAAWRAAEDLLGVQIDTSSPYEVLSLIPLPDEAALRSAGERYPDWVRQRFLPLPEEVPERVRALAIRLTASQPTPFDRAKAIESYLRTFPYTLDVPRPPQDRDVVDFFLFDLRKGYCDYYASAMVVLARAAGIPARLAVGYTSGTYVLNSKRFVVTEADAHSWVEVYFPGIGWVPFEPTPSQPALGRSEPTTPEAPQVVPSQPAASGGRESQAAPWAGRFVLGFLFLAAFALLAWAGLDAVRLRRLSAPSAAAELYRRLQRAGRHLAVISKPGDTPYEYARTLNDRLRREGTRLHRTSLGEQTADRIGGLIDGIVRASYHPSPAAGRTLPSLWEQLRARLVMVWLLGRWMSLQASTRRMAAGLSEGWKALKNGSEEHP